MAFPHYGLVVYVNFMQYKQHFNVYFIHFCLLKVLFDVELRTTLALNATIQCNTLYCYTSNLRYVSYVSPWRYLYFLPILGHFFYTLRLNAKTA